MTADVTRPFNAWVTVYWLKPLNHPEVRTPHLVAVAWNHTEEIQIRFSRYSGPTRSVYYRLSRYRRNSLKIYIIWSLQRSLKSCIKEYWVGFYTLWWLENCHIQRETQQWSSGYSRGYELSWGLWRNFWVLYNLSSDEVLNPKPGNI